MTSKMLLSIVIILLLVSGCGGKQSVLSENEKNKSKTFMPNKEDIVQDSFELTNVDKLEQFISNMSNKQPNKIRVVRYLEGVKFDDPDVPMIYDLQYVYDMQAQVGWVQVQPDASHVPAKQAEKEIKMKNPQQCSTITKDEERGYYMLTECHDAWEYVLFPLEGDIVGKTRGSGW
ncbi:DUF4362 domain-containing protein [Fictibacillus barbaricus]|uniref:Lipoprotein n=1 Tax=Fictibacillus barbaricus TaxID=182136 RepID=A0ABU1TWF0_9BACL|nr:DUF4362 domain-containing protein [Fictibacillus barbaricus]MDR7071499.1 hypothetical protein [Fictibacillus barbaricus]